MREYFNATLGRWQVRLADGRRVYRYRWVMEQLLGRSLQPDEHVHHINGDSTDDRPENLRIVSPAEHRALHAPDQAAAREARRKYAWSPKHPCCVECGTTERAFVGLGRCSRCYYRQHARKVRGYSPRQPATVLTLTCEECGTTFTRTLAQNASIRRFCGPSCAGRANTRAKWARVHEIGGRSLADLSREGAA